MKQYNIYENSLGAREAVKQGWSWPAFFFTWIWAFIKKMNAIGGGVLGAWFFLGFLFAVLENSMDPDSASTLSGLLGVVEIALLIVFGVNGNNWRERNLTTRGYQLKGTVSAATDEAALGLYAKPQQPTPTA